MSRADARLNALCAQIAPQQLGAAGVSAVQPKTTSQTTDDLISSKQVKWNGWGYKDTEFYLNEAGLVALRGSRYLFSGKALPDLRKWMEDKVGLNINDKTPPQNSLTDIPAPVQNEAFMKAIAGSFKRSTVDAAERVFHSHGHTCEEMWELRYGHFPRYVDMVIWPGSHAHVEAIVKAAVTHNVMIIPYGGGTSVSYALLCPTEEKRMIVSLDMHEMRKIKWINHKSMTACIEAGAVGRQLEDALLQYGLCLGHEPDSMEFSTLGGWIATRASGMRKNKYGNIEDIVVKITMVTPAGTIEKGCQVPRMSTGPDVNEIMLGSEGTYGVVTEAVVRLRPAPKVRQYGALVFPDFEAGVSCLHEIAIKRCAPVSIRLIDNMQFQFAQALKPARTSKKEIWMDKIKKWYILNHRGFDVNKMCGATLLFEGSAQEVREQERQVYEIASLYGGMKAGAENGVRGYFLTYMIAYLRDFGFNYSFMAESFETSVPWDNVQPLCVSVKERIAKAAKDRGVQGTPFISCRVTQLYDTGACVYFYFGFVFKGLKNPIHVFSEVEEEARDEILKHGGSLSHHHGVGKLRKKWMERTISATGIKVLKGVKQTLDPTNVFGSNNLIDP